MPASAELMDRGLSAYTRGERAEAERCWREALALDPKNDRLRGYLALLDRDAAVERPAPLRAAPAPAPSLSVVTPPEPVPAPPALEVASAEEFADEFAPSPWDDGPSLSPTLVLAAEGGIDLKAVDRPEPAPQSAPAGAPVSSAKKDIELWMEGARELFALGDFSGSLEMLEKILHLEPGHAEARAYLAQNEATLVQMYESKLGSLSNVPRLVIKPEEVMWLNLDHRAGFVLAQIDGKVSVEDLYALSGLTRLETARILAGLLGEGVIRV